MIEARNLKTGAVMTIYYAAYKANPKNWEPLDETLAVNTEKVISNTARYKENLTTALARGHRKMIKLIHCETCRSKKKIGCRTCNEN